MSKETYSFQAEVKRWVIAPGTLLPIVEPLNFPTGNMQKLVVCWGGHSIGRAEYEYTKDVGYSMGLRGCSVITGCGPGAMKGPMKGATIAHAKQHMPNRRYIGLTEPGIVASEPPNPIVNELVILPDIEKRLEAFVRFGHAILVFPGGAGTAEEVLYLMGLLMHPDNIDIPLPVILTAPEASKDYWSSMIEFLRATIGEKAVSKLKVIVNDPEEVARAVNEGIQEVEEFFVSNFIYSTDPGTMWIGEMMKDGEGRYTDWKKKVQSLSYIFREEVESLLSVFEVKSLAFVRER